MSDFDDVAQIREQNLQQVLQMSEADMKEAMDSIASLISPQMLEYLRRRQPSADMVEAVQARSPPQPAPPPEPIDLSSIQTEEDLMRAAATMLPETEKKKLAWTGMFEADEQASPQQDATPAILQALRSEVKSTEEKSLIYVRVLTASVTYYGCMSCSVSICTASS
jgi:hypothetical protein